MKNIKCRKAGMAAVSIRWNIVFVIWFNFSSRFIKRVSRRPFQRYFFRLSSHCSLVVHRVFFSFITECGVLSWVMFPLESITDGKLVKENPYTQCAGGWVLGRRAFCPRRLSHSRTLAGSCLVVEQGIKNIQVSWFLLQALTFVPWIHCVTSDRHFPQLCNTVNTGSYPTGTLWSWNQKR